MVTISVNEIPVELMCEAIKVADVHQIMILERKKHNIGNGEPDVAVVSPLGRKEMMHRKDIVKSFVTVSGKKIVLSRLRYGTKYTVMRLQRVGVYAFKVPKSHSIRVIMSNGKEARRGGYLVCEADDTNSVDMTNANWVDSKFFRKMFKIEKIPKLHEISKSLGKDFMVNRKIVDSVNENEQEHYAKNDSNIAEEKVVDKKLYGDTYEKDNDSVASVVARIVRLGSNENIGFVVRFYGKNEKMNISKVKKLCNMKLVSNMKLVERDGKTFLAGVGMRIEDLPVVRI